jgi:ribonuclease HI
MGRSLEIYIDGSSKGNPGPSSIGVVICENGQTIKNLSNCIGQATNNVAEYTALISGLKEARALKADSVKVNTDSQLLYRQIKKIYKVRSPHIAQLYNQATSLMADFKIVDIRHIPRGNNCGADKLANLAIKKRVKGCSL